MKQNILKKIITAAMIFSAFILVLTPATHALAINADDYWGGSTQKDYVNTNSGLADGGTARDPRQIVVDIIKFVLGFLGILALIIILYAGFKWMTSGGNEESVGSAKKMLVAGVIGLVIILSAYALATFIINQIIGATTGTTVS
ncbi:MAG: TrbC/VirB2 family protein [bacterium]|nr:TrbC/VirB2 family protein [bacterium]